MTIFHPLGEQPVKLNPYAVIGRSDGLYAVLLFLACIIYYLGGCDVQMLLLCITRFISVAVLIQLSTCPTSVG